MLVDDNIDIDTLGYRLSPLLCRGSVNNPSGLWIVNHILKLYYLVERKSNFGYALSSQIRITRRRYAKC